jgi:hypothetical protein
MYLFGTKTPSSVYNLNLLKIELVPRDISEYLRELFQSVDR